MDEVASVHQADVPEYIDIRDDRANLYFGIPKGQSKTYRILLNASYKGRYYLPAVNCEAMYDAAIHSRTQGRWVEITERKQALSKK
jgi:uncharacterized protein YfaS (alpha-2-macroglobulin family)